MNKDDMFLLKTQYDELKDHLTPEEKLKIRRLMGLEPPDFIEWAEEHFYVPETNSPIKLYYLQKAAIREAMRKDDDGLFIYSTVVWGDIKKSAKTTIGAARALYTAIYQDFAMVRVIGNDRDQAESRLFYYIVRCLKINKELAKRIGARVIKNKITLGNNSYIEAIAVDPEGEAGGGDDLTVFTELWGARTEAHKRLWTETTLSPLKYGVSQRWCESYAGVRGQSPLLEVLYDRCVVEDDEEEANLLGGRRLSKEHPFYTDETGNIFCMWNHEPHVPWQTEEYYENERATLLEHEFLRVHRNYFLDSQQRYVDDAKLRNCYGSVSRLGPDSVLILASDAAYASDTYGLVGILYDPVSDIIELVFEQMWQALKGQEIDLSQPEAVVRRLAQKHIVLVWAYDPYQLKRTAQSLEAENQDFPITTYQFIQQGKRSIADKALLDRIGTSDIILPEDSITATHLRNADMKVQSAEKIRIVKRSGASGGPIDLAVCLSMAVYVAVSEKHKFPRPVRFNSDTGGEQRTLQVNSDERQLPIDKSFTTLPTEIYER